MSEDGLMHFVFKQNDDTLTIVAGSKDEAEFHLTRHVKEPWHWELVAVTPTASQEAEVSLSNPVPALPSESEQDYCDGWLDGSNAVIQAATEKDREIKRLREALEKIAYGTGPMFVVDDAPTIHAVALEALSPSKDGEV